MGEGEGECEGQRRGGDGPWLREEVLREYDRRVGVEQVHVRVALWVRRCAVVTLLPEEGDMSEWEQG